MPSPVARRLFTTSLRRLDGAAAGSPPVWDRLRDEIKKHPELYILGVVMSVTIVGASAYFGRSPTGATGQKHVQIADDGMPWNSDMLGKYKYHPRANPQSKPKQAPSAVHVTIVPDVTLTKAQHEAFRRAGNSENY